MDFITYEQKYEHQIVELWNKSLLFDLISVDMFRKQILFDENFDSDLCLIATVESKVVGFLLATKRKFPYLERGLEPERGFINVMFVDETIRRQKIGEKLLKMAEEKLYKLGARRITLGAYSPNYFFPGIDEDNYKPSQLFFDQMGYKSGDVSFSMKKDLHGYHFNESVMKKYDELLKSGFEIKSFDIRYTIKLLNFARDEFGGGWKRNILISMQSSLAEQNILIVTDLNDDIVGFAMRMIDGNPMRFGPIGISERVRNYGIGGVLFDFMQFEMTKRHIYHLYFVTTDIPGRRFYERHGLEVFRTFYDYEKYLEG